MLQLLIERTAEFKLDPADPPHWIKSLYAPTKTAVSTNGDIYIADGITIDPRDVDNPVLLVTSRKQSSIKRFTLDGRYLDQIDLPGGYPRRPVIHGDCLFVSLCWSGSHMKPNSEFVNILDCDNQICAAIGGNADTYDAGDLINLTTDYSTFCHVHDACVDTGGDVYVCQWNAGKIYPYKLTPK